MNVYSVLTEQEEDILFFIKEATRYMKIHSDLEFIPLREMIDTGLREEKGVQMRLEESRKYLMEQGYIDKDCNLTVKGKRYLDWSEEQSKQSKKYERQIVVKNQTNISLIHTIKKPTLFKIGGKFDMKKIVISSIAIIIAVISLLILKMNNVSAIPAVNINVDIPEQQEEVIQENTVDEVENIIEEEPEQEVDTVEPEQITQETEPDPEPVEEVTDQIEVTSLDKIMYAQSEVNTRIGDSTDYEKVGSLTTNQAVHVIGQSVNTSWYKIEIDGTEQFVSNKYLADAKVEVQPSKTETQVSQSQTPPPANDGQPNVPSQELLDSLGLPSGFTWDGTISEKHGISDIDVSGINAE